jgi:hypothetical protein
MKVEKTSFDLIPTGFLQTLKPCWFAANCCVFTCLSDDFKGFPNNFDNQLQMYSPVAVWECDAWLVDNALVTNMRMVFDTIHIHTSWFYYQ